MNSGFSMSSFVVGVMMGTLLTGAWLLHDIDLPKLPTARTSATITSAPESGAISVTTQPSGTEVTVESVTVPPPGVWVAVRDVTEGDLGNVLGAARVDGPRSNISIPLLRATEPNLTYAIELYRDDGGNDFDLASDSVYVDFTTGAPVIAHFTTTN
jgi:hypothetical protein